MSGLRTLTQAMTVHRLGDAGGLYPAYSGLGAAAYPGRWNARDQRVVYTCEHYSTALLEKLVRTTVMPTRQQRIEITLPAGLSYEALGPESLRGWDDPVVRSARAFGARWYAEARSVLLFVPSVIAWPDRNVLINETHPDAARMSVGEETLVRWDERLFGG